MAGYSALLVVVAAFGAHAVARMVSVFTRSPPTGHVAGLLNVHAAYGCMPEASRSNSDVETVPRAEQGTANTAPASEAAGSCAALLSMLSKQSAQCATSIYKVTASPLDDPHVTALVMDRDAGKYEQRGGRGTSGP